MNGAPLQRFIVERTGAVVAERVAFARTFSQRLVGLLGRAQLASDEGLLIEPCNSVHTFFMRFTIDVAFLDREGNIVRTVANLRPWRATRIHPTAHATLELSKGALARADVQPGDRLISQRS